MPITGTSQIIYVSGGGTAIVDHCECDTNDDLVRPSETGTFYAVIVDADGNRIPRAGVTVNWSLTKNGSAYAGSQAVLSGATSTTDVTGTATITVAYGSGAAADDFFQVSAAP